MMLFDKTPSEHIVIVPPQPDFAFRTQDELTYSNLYCYDDAGAASASASAPPPADVPSPGGGGAGGGSAADAGGDPTPPPTPASNGSFDSAGFDGSGRPPAGTPRSNPAVEGGGGEDGGPLARRDPRNGAFTFRVHAEYDLLLHVQGDLAKRRHHPSSAGAAADDDDVELSRTILRSVDEYCLSQQWMYHVGSEKGRAIGRFLREGAEDFRARGETKTFTCVELGTYCGYSALVLASTLREFARDLPPLPQKFDFHIYTTEVSSKLLNVAQSVFRLAKMEGRITPILVKEEKTPKASDGEKKERSAPPGGPGALLASHGVVDRIDFLLLDHAKHRYLDDLRDLEDAGLLRAGSRVSADNVVFNRLDAYRDHVHGREAVGIVESRLEEMNLEYSNNLKDGIEMTVYLKDPPTKE